MITPESGARLEYINVSGTLMIAAGGAVTMSAILYVNAGSDVITSTDPYADYWDQTEPPTLNSELIRKSKLEVRRVVMPANANFPIRFSFKRRLRRPITLNQSTDIVLAVKHDSGVAINLQWNSIAVVRK